MRVILLMIAISAGVTACSSSEGHPAGPPPPGCDDSGVSGTCVAQAGLTAADCTAGTFVPEGCPMANWVGSCTDVSTGEATYYYSPNSPWFSHSTCDGNGGVWTGTGAPLASGWCDATGSYGDCVDVSGPADEVASFEIVCGWVGAWHTVGACPALGRTGTCSSVSGGLSLEDRYYDPTTAASDAASCTGGGDVWTPG